MSQHHHAEPRANDLPPSAPPLDIDGSPDISWLRKPDSKDPEASKVGIAFECCDPQCLAMCDSGEDE